MKIRLIEPGMKRFTGFIAEVEFKDGVSIEDVTRREADLIASAMRTEAVDGDTPLAAARSVAGKDVSAEVVKALKRGDEDTEADESVEIEVPEGTEVEGVDEVPEDEEVQDAVAVEAPSTYTFEQLAAVADEKGIVGLREIAAEFGVKGRSVKDLIGNILEASGQPAQATVEG